MQKMLDVNVALELETGNSPMWVVKITDEWNEDKYMTFRGFPTPDDLGKDLTDFLERHYVKDCSEVRDDEQVIGDLSELEE